MIFRLNLACPDVDLSKGSLEKKHAGSTNPVKICLIAKCQILKTTKPTLQNTQHHTLSYRHTHRHTLTHTHIHTTWFCANPRSAHTFLQQILRPQERARTHFYDKFCYEAPRNPFWSISKPRPQNEPRKPLESHFGGFPSPGRRMGPGNSQKAIIKHFQTQAAE